MRRALVSLTAAILIAGASAGSAMAVPGVSFRLGAGKVIDHGGLVTAGIELGLPVLPVSFRADADLTSPGSGDRHLNLIASAAYSLTFPVVHPYVVGGVGRYHTGKDDAQTGVSLGAGVRAGVAGLGAFGEVRWHEPISATTLAIGITF